jgi:hypothetical protein
LRRRASAVKGEGFGGGKEGYQIEGGRLLLRRWRAAVKRTTPERDRLKLRRIR